MRRFMWGLALICAVFGVGAYCIFHQAPSSGNAVKEMPPVKDPAPSVTEARAPAPDAPPVAKTLHALAKDWSGEAVGEHVEKGVKWLASVQGSDGGWGQDGGEVSYARKEIKLESNGNDVANTAVSALAFIRAGHTVTRGVYTANVRKAVEFVLKHVEDSDDKSLAVNTPQNTQIQRKLGPNIDTFMASMLLAEVDGTMPDAAANARVRKAVNKIVAKIEKNQSKDGSWNTAGGWAPILGTSYGSRSLDLADRKGAQVSKQALKSVQDWTVTNAEASIAEDKKMASATRSAPGEGAGVATVAGGGGWGGGSGRPAISASAKGNAGVKLYEYAQTVEQLSRSSKDRTDNALAIEHMSKELIKDETIRGYGSMGGEEFFSYLNSSDSLHRIGGDSWEKWNTKIKAHIDGLQNRDGTWSGQHCITGRVACTAAAVLALLAERAPIEVSMSK